MKLITTVVVLLTIWSCKNASESKKSTYQDDVRNVFEEFNVARVEKDGKKIYELSDEQSHAYYDSILDWSLNTPKRELDQMRLIDQINVLTARIIFKDSLKSMNSKDLMIMTFSKSSMSQVQENATRNVKLGPLVKVNEHKVSSTINGVTPIEFIKENGAWKYNYTSLIDFANSQMENQRISNQEYIALILNSPELLKYSDNGYFLYPEIYTPIKD